MKINYLRKVEKAHRKNAFARDIAVKFITRTSIVKLFQKHELRLDSRISEFNITSSLKMFEDVLIMAHFDHEKQLSQPDLYLLRSFADAGFEIVLVTTALSHPNEHERFWNQVSPIVNCLITRPNEGFDFGSWAVAINQLQISERVSGRLVLINNSMFGPFVPISELLADWPLNCEVYGITSSNEFVKHVQSYFLGFRSAAVKSEAFQRYWKSEFREKNKWLTIFRFEMQWAKYFSTAGFNVGVRHRPPNRFLRNPLTFCWNELLMTGMPFLKKSLFRQNYDHIELSNALAEIRKLNSDFPLEYIETHLNSVPKN